MIGTAMRSATMVGVVLRIAFNSGRYLVDDGLSSAILSNLLWAWQMELATSVGVAAFSVARVESGSPSTLSTGYRNGGTAINWPRTLALSGRGVRTG